MTEKDRDIIMDTKSDNKYVMIVKTFKNRKFAISHKFDPDAIRDNILIVNFHKQIT